MPLQSYIPQRRRAASIIDGATVRSSLDLRAMRFLAALLAHPIQGTESGNKRAAEAALPTSIARRARARRD
jgi:hypothetical protein